MTAKLEVVNVEGKDNPYRAARFAVLKAERADVRNGRLLASCDVQVLLLLSSGRGRVTFYFFWNFFFIQNSI